MVKLLLTVLAFFVGASQATAQKDAVGYHEYENLDHTISIQSLRAGSHDPSGTNDYYFIADMYSLINSSDERNLEFAKRKKIYVGLGTFAETELESLKTWKHDGKSAGKGLAVAGDAIRKLAAETMQEFKVQESEVAIMIEITMFEKAKKFYFWGEDTLIAKTVYFPISQTNLEKTADSELSLLDDKGTNVLVHITYKNLGKNAAKKQAGM